MDFKEFRKQLMQKPIDTIEEWKNNKYQRVKNGGVKKLKKRTQKITKKYFEETLKLGDEVIINGKLFTMDKYGLTPGITLDHPIQRGIIDPPVSKKYTKEVKKVIKKVEEKKLEERKPDWIKKYRKYIMDLKKK